MGAWAGTVATCRRDRLLSRPSLVSRQAAVGEEAERLRTKESHQFSPCHLLSPATVLGRCLNQLFPCLLLDVSLGSY